MEVMLPQSRLIELNNIHYTCEGVVTRIETSRSDSTSLTKIYFEEFPNKPFVLTKLLNDSECSKIIDRTITIDYHDISENNEVVSFIDHIFVDTMYM